MSSTIGNQTEAKQYANRKRSVTPVEYKACKKFENSLAVGEIVAHIELSDDDAEEDESENDTAASGFIVDEPPSLSNEQTTDVRIYRCFVTK